MSTNSQNPRVALVTGASGGLGRGLAQELVAQGWKVAGTWHRQNVLPEHECFHPVHMDITQSDSVAAAINQIHREWGAVDLLINNAGLACDAPLLQMQEADWDRVLNTNLKGAMLCAQAVLPGMQARRTGHIINISSFAARTGTRGQANYAAAKAGLIGFTQSLAREAGEFNVRVNAVLPGVLPTAMTQSLPASTLAAFARANTLSRINSIAEVARFVVFLAGMENVSGQIFQLDSRIARWS